MRKISWWIIATLLLLVQTHSLWAGWRQDGSNFNLISENASWTKTTVYNNVPYVVWQEGNSTTVSNIYVKYWNGGSWSRLGNTVNSDNAYHPSITVGYNGTVYVACQEIVTTENHINVRKWNGSSWEMIGSDLRYDGLKHYAHNPSIDINPASATARLQLAFVEDSAGNTAAGQIYWMELNGTNWNYVMNGAGYSVTSGNVSTAYGNLSINYGRYVTYIKTSDNRAYVSGYDRFGLTWPQLGSALNVDPSQVAITPILGRSSSGQLSAVWGEKVASVSDHKLYLKQWDGVAWQQLGTNLDWFANTIAEYPSMAFAGETPYVVWRETSNSIYARHWDGANWVWDFPAPGSLSYRQYPQMMVVNGIPFVALSETSNPSSVDYTLRVFRFMDGVTQVSPGYASVGKQTKVTVFSEEFYPSAISLVGNGVADLLGTNIVNNNKRSNSATFNLSQAVPGMYAVKMNMIGMLRTLENAFQILTTYPASYAWQVNEVGTAGTPTTSGLTGHMIIGDPDRTGARKLFVANLDRQPYRFNKSGQSWQKTTLPAGTSAELSTSLVLADTNSDRVQELYAGQTNAFLSRFETPSWSRTKVGQGTVGSAPKFYAVIAGDLYGEGYERIFAAGDSGQPATAGVIYSFENPYDQNTYVSVSITGCPASPVYSLAIGDGNNDAYQELYSANADGKVYQYSYLTATPVNITTLGSSDGLAMDTVAVGDGDNDGSNEVYASCLDGKIYQFRQSVSTWTVQAIGTVAPQALHGLAVSDADSNGTTELYAACANGHVYQYSSQGGQWVVADIGNTNTALYALAVGDADNDNRYELYALGGNNHVYQFQLTAPPATPTATPRPVPETYFKVFKNQIDPTVGEQAVIRWSQPKDGNVSIKIYNLLGDKVAVLAENQSFAKGQFNELKWNGRNSNGNVVASGIYIVDFISDNHKARGKIAVVK